MESLKKKILEEGRVLDGDILKIDSFLNHMIDVNLTLEIGKEFKRRFGGTIDKILTVEASGIGAAIATSMEYNNVPVLFAKKVKCSLMADEVYASKEHSYTRGVDYVLQVSKNYLKEGERVLIIDDFLANGEAINALVDICRQAKAEIVGAGAVVCKTYQPGEKRILDQGVKVEVLARVKSLENGKVEFE